MLQRCCIYSRPNCICVDPALSNEVMSDILQRLLLSTEISLNRVDVISLFYVKFFFMV